LKDTFKYGFSSNYIFSYNYNWDPKGTKMNLTNKGDLLLCNITYEMCYINEKNVWK